VSTPWSKAVRDELIVIHTSEEPTPPPPPITKSREGFILIFIMKL